MKDHLIHRKYSDLLGEAREELMERRWHTKEGVICPCCDRSASVARLSITRAMISSLAWIYHNTKEGEYIHFNEKCPSRNLVKSASHMKLKNWRLVEQKPNHDDPEKNASGYVRITEIGRLWLRNETTVRRYCFIYNQQHLGMDGEPVSIKDYCAKDFNYERDVMAPAVAA